MTDDWYSPYGYFKQKDKRTDEQKDYDMYDFYDVFGYIPQSRRKDRKENDSTHKARKEGDH